MTDIDYERYYSKRACMTNAEKTLYKLMNKTLNDTLKVVHKSVTILPCVRLADFIGITGKIDMDKKALYEITSKHIDYLICESDTLDIICAVELDDVYHDMPSKVIRDKKVERILKQCNLELFRIKEPIKRVDIQTLSKIIDFILNHYAPKCPVCGTQTLLKIYRDRRGCEHRLYECRNWYNGKGCNYSLNIY